MSAHPGAPDVGLETVTEVRRLLAVDDAWSIDLPHGFAWWAYRTRQDVEAQAVVRSDGLRGARIRVRTRLLSAPTAGGAAVRHILAGLNGRTSGGAFRLLPDGTVGHEVGAFVAEEAVDWVTRAVATMAMVALSQGGALAGEAASALGSQPLASGHPGSGLRPWPDDMLNLDAAVLVPTGAMESLYADPGAFATAASMANSGIGFAADTTGEHGLLCELGFGAANSSLLALRPTCDRPRPVAPGLPPDAPDPVYGHGLIAWLVLPCATTLPAAEASAARLNEAEAEAATDELAGTMAFGAWTVSDVAGRPAPAYRMFLPNLLAPVVSVTNVALHLFVRARNASRLLLPGEEPLDGAGIARLRMRQAPDVFGLPRPH